jgi:CRP/FNR family cyclic AMP-dependent transcriptional regulator
MALDLPERGAPTARPAAGPLLARAAPARVALLGPPELRHPLRQALAEDGFRLIEAELDHPLSGSLTSEPDLIVVAPPPEADVAVAVGTASKAAKGQPVMAVLDGAVDEHVLRQIGEFAADVVVAPCSPPNLRARVRACLARQLPSGTRPPVTERPALMDTLQLADRLSAAELEGMLQVGTRCGFRPGEMMFRQGDPPTGVYYLHAGLVRLVVQGDGGREVTVGFAGAGDMVGEMSVLDGAPRSESALAMEPVDASYVPRDAFHQTLERVPQASVRLLRMLTRRLRDADQRLARGATDGRAAENESATPGQQTAGVDGVTVASAHLADLEEALEREVRRARRLRYPIGLLIGRVEQADPAAGLGNGSLRLSGLAAALQDALRGTEVVASSPAGDLSIILPGLPPEGLARVEARVRRAIQYALEGHGVNEARLEVRVGGSVVQPDEADARRLLQRAVSSLHASAQL